MKSLLSWLDARFPLSEIWNEQLAKYYAPKNLNFWYFFGVLSLLVLANQLFTGIWLTMYYTPTANEAFGSVQHIMNSVKYGWLLRYMHSTGASAFFIVVYLHMYRALIYGSYRAPRELLWLIGMVLYTLLVAESFTGYVLPWGQMSYWAAQVINSLLRAIPFIGDAYTNWLFGDYGISEVTLHRFFAFHVAAIPMLIVLFVLLHLIALRTVGSNNPDGVEIKEHVDQKNIPEDGVAFYPYYTIKDLFGVIIFLIVFVAIIFFAPTMHGYFLEPENFTPANPLVTPENIHPAWYLSPFYAILRAIPNKALGITAMAAAIAILYVLPWLDRSRVKSIRYKGKLSKLAITLLVISFVGLGFLGTQSINPISLWLSRLFTLIYFAFFILMPIYTRHEEIKPVPSRVTSP